MCLVHVTVMDVHVRVAVAWKLPQTLQLENSCSAGMMWLIPTSLMVPWGHVNVSWGHVIWHLGVLLCQLVHWLWNPASWHVCMTQLGDAQMLKCVSWDAGHVGTTLPSTLLSAMDLIWSSGARVSKHGWWYQPCAGSCYWMKRTAATWLLTLGLRRCRVCWLNGFGGPSSGSPARRFVGTARYVNELRTVLKLPLVCLHPSLCPPVVLGLGQWISLPICLLVLVLMPFSPVLTDSQSLYV